MTLRFCAGLLILSSACSQVPGINDGGFKDAGPKTECSATKPCAEGQFCLAGFCEDKFSKFELDENGGPELTYLAMASDPATERVGVAYFAQVDGFKGAKAADGGNTPNYEVRYVEWKQGVASAPQMIRTVQRLMGIAVAFQQSGEPAVSYLGGGSDMSAFWYQSDAVVAYRSGTTWTEQLVAARSEPSPCSSPPLALDQGFAVGLFPALAFDGPKAYVAWRDVHNGQFPQQDWAASYIKVSEGGPTSWTTKCQVPVAEGKLAYGARLNMVMANGQPAMVSDRALGGADTVGRDIMFTRRKADGTWTNSITPALIIGNTMSGGSLAWDAMEGYGIAVLEHSDDTLLYTRSMNGAAWSTADHVLGGGSTGWYPSLAMDPVNHEPAIAFYTCSKANGKAEGTCSPAEDELRVIQRVVGNWKEELVDLEGGYLPKVGFFASGKRFVAYRVPSSKKIRLAVER